MADISTSANGNFVVDHNKVIRYAGGTIVPSSSFAALSDELRDVMSAQQPTSVDPFFFDHWVIYVPATDSLQVEVDIFTAAYLFIQMTTVDNRYRMYPSYRIVNPA